MPSWDSALSSRSVESSDFWDWYEKACAEGWTEGLPVCPPTVERVSKVIEYLGRDPAEVVGTIPPMGGQATIEQIAVNAVMAGCTPELVPIVLAAVDAVLDPTFELAPAQVTTNACAPLVIVSGTMVTTLGFNDGSGSFAGQGRANVSVGRALRLILRNIGGSIPGLTSGLVHGHPGWLSYCIAEKTGVDLWPSFQVERGFPATVTCVTVFFCQAPFPVYVPGSAKRILNVLAATLPTPGVNMYFGGGEILLAFSPKPASELMRAGYTRADVRDRLWEAARYELGRLRSSGVFEQEAHTFYWGARRNAPPLDGMPDSARLPMVDRPEDLHVLVTGGNGQWWVGFCPGWGEFGGLAVTRQVDWPTPA